MNVSTIAAALGLPGDVVSWDAVGGAWSNRLFHVATTGGQFAVKQLLNPWDDPHWLDWLHEAAGFEQACIDAGVAAPAIHLNPEGHVFSQVDDAWFRVHEWVIDGRACMPGPVSPDVARAVGRELAVIHGVGWQPSRDDVFPTVTGDQATLWPQLIEKLRRVAPEFAAIADSVSEPVAQIAEWLAEPRDSEAPVMSHGDVDPKNLVLAGRTWLIDWDVAMPWRPVEEVARAAMSLADGSDPRIAVALVASYEAEAGTALVLERDCLTMDLAIGLDWLARCLRRASGLEACSPRRAQEAREQAVAQAASLRRRVAIADRVGEWLGR